MRRFINPAFGLLLLAVVLAVLHVWHGVTTDEAKYLLNIPYPHPPLARWFIGLTQWIPGQEYLWRIVLAVSLLQAAWISRGLAPKHVPSSPLLLMSLWVLSAGVFVSAGQILLAPITALQMLVFCYWLLKGEELEPMIGWVALLWMASLFTAYQAILFFPVVAVVFWRMRLPKWQRLSGLFGPILLLLLYTATNPLTFASMVTAGRQNLDGGTMIFALRGTVWLWVLGGSLVLSVLGTLGMVLSRRWSLVASLLLVGLFIFVSFRPYYAILFAPLLVAGLASAPALMRRPAMVVLSSLLCGFILIPFAYPRSQPSPAPAVSAQAQAANVPVGATAIIAGSFGHEWQEAGPYLIRRYVTNYHLIDSARIAVCLADCPDVRKREGWQRLENVPVEVWVRPLLRDEG